MFALCSSARTAPGSVLQKPVQCNASTVLQINSYEESSGKSVSTGGPRKTKKHQDKSTQILPGKAVVSLEVKVRQNQETDQEGPREPKPTGSGRAAACFLRSLQQSLPSCTRTWAQTPHLCPRVPSAVWLTVPRHGTTGFPWTPLSPQRPGAPAASTSRNTLS